MNYKNLYADFHALFPDCADELKKFAKKADADETDGMHILFSFVVIPFVMHLLEKSDDGKLSKAFDYFEKMASSDSADVTEVLEFTVVENLMSHGQLVYDKLKKYMGENMLACCKRVEQYLQIGE